MKNFTSKATYKCPKCGSTRFEVTKTCDITFPLKATVYKNFKVKDMTYKKFIEFNWDKSKDRIVEEDRDVVRCCKCDFEIDFETTHDVNID